MIKFFTRQLQAPQSGRASKSAISILVDAWVSDIKHSPACVFHVPSPADALPTLSAVILRGPGHLETGVYLLDTKRMAFAVKL